MEIADLIFEVRPGDENAQPLFVVHETTEGDPHVLILPDRLPAEMPVYGLSAVPMGEEQPRTLEALASWLALAVRKKCSGPYRLAGWSFGGALAYEVASHLLAQDEEVEFLGLIDSRAPSDRSSSEIELPRTARSAMLRLIEQVAPGTHDRLREMDSATTFSDLLGIARQRDYLPSRFKNRTTSDIEKYGTRLCTYYNACASYRPEPIGIPLDLFIAEESPLEGRPTSDPANRYNGWDAYTSPASIRVARVAATQHASSTASAITDALHDALQRIGPRASIKPRVEYVVDVQSGTPHRAPIVCVPGAGDGALAFVDMATAFPDSVPIRAFQARGLTYADVPHGTVESAAKAYLNALDTEHPADAIHLVGHSFGGWVAFEMACIMASRGRSPLSLTIIDATPPGQQIQEYSPDEVFDEWVRTLELAADRDFDLNSAALSEMRYADRIRAVHQKLVEFGMMPASSRWDVLRGPLRTFGAALRAGYVPTTSLPFAVNFVFADDPRESLRANLDLQNQYYREWLNWAPAGTRWRGPGNHITILDAPHVNELVRWWQSDQRRDAV